MADDCWAADFPNELGDLYMREAAWSVSVAWKRCLFISAAADVPPARNEAAEVARFVILLDNVAVASSRACLAVRTCPGTQTQP